MKVSFIIKGFDLSEPYELAFGPERAALASRTAAEVYEKLYGEPPPAGSEADAASLEAQRDLWHLSVSWRGGHQAGAARILLEDLIVALGVPEGQREGRQPARVYSPDGRQSAQVTHWTWKDPQESTQPAVQEEEGERR